MARETRSRLVRLSLGVCAGVVLIVTPSAAAKAKGFEYGVAAGDVTSSSAILWAKAKRSGKVEVQVAAKGGFGACDPAAARLTARAKRSHDNTLSKRVGKLDPDTAYRYRFCMAGGARSDTGRFTTAPKPMRKRTIRFAFTGDQDARPVPGGEQPFWNNFEVWKRIKAQRNDFNILLGDTIYSDTEVPGYGLADVALTVEQKWQAYKTNLAMKPWSKARGSAAYYAHWDDHEFINDFSPREDSFPLGVGDVNLDGETLYRRGAQAFTDYNPIRYSKRDGIYRQVRWGKNLELFLLDERSFRSAGAEYAGACDNPPGSGDPDLAPTAPQSTRNAFSAIAPTLANPVSQECLATINDPERTMLGERQLDRFKRAVERSTATFKVVMSEMPVQQYYTLPYDRWEGYEAERQELLRFLADRVDNVVVLTTDVHANLVNDARYCTLGDGCPQDSGITEVTTGPVATATYSLEINDALGNPSAGPLVHTAFFKPQPPAGIGMRCAAMDQFSYGQVEVGKNRLTVDLLDSANAPVQDTGDRSAPAPPCARVVIDKQ